MGERLAGGNVEAEAAAIRESSLPDKYATDIETGGGALESSSTTA
jgi:hypothetical protein